ncbi:MAG: VWA domain-containing protein [Chitinophagales bacterium]|nr:VWA domain-containing protein [Chitinophagales bacterium]MCZ2392425.1 VWA domain-containing protein [Chitinophagales bacterium]
METKTPIEYAKLSVFVKGTSDIYSATSDSNGFYSISVPDTWIEAEYGMRLEHGLYYLVNGIVLVKNEAIRDFYMKRKEIEALEDTLVEKTVEEALMPTSNIVFLIDVSKSMNEEHKIEILKIAMKKLASLLRDSDKLSIVTYSTDAQIYLKTTTGAQLERINEAIDALKCNGITMSGLGLELAFHVAKKNYIKGQNNKVILNTDGIFTSTQSKQYKTMEKLIEKMRSKKIALTVFSYGDLMPKTKDNLRKMSVLGGGTYAHIENKEMAIEEVVDEAKNLGVFDK